MPLRVSARGGPCWQTPKLAGARKGPGGAVISPGVAEGLSRECAVFDFGALLPSHDRARGSPASGESSPARAGFLAAGPGREARVP